MTHSIKLIIFSSTKEACVKSVKCRREMIVFSSLMSISSELSLIIDTVTAAVLFRDHLSSIQTNERQECSRQMMMQYSASLFHANIVAAVPPARTSVPPVLACHDSINSLGENVDDGTFSLSRFFVINHSSNLRRKEDTAGCR